MTDRSGATAPSSASVQPGIGAGRRISRANVSVLRTARIVTGTAMAMPSAPGRGAPRCAYPAGARSQGSARAITASSSSEMYSVTVSRLKKP